VSDYNYERFDAHVAAGEDERELCWFPDFLHAGERAPDGKLRQLGGPGVRLGELWRRQSPELS